MRRRLDPARFVFAVGRRVRELRRARRLTQEALAEELGVTTAYVQAIERGTRNMTLFTLARVADALAVEPIQLMVAPATDEAVRKGRPSKAHSVERAPVVISVAREDLAPARHRNRDARETHPPKRREKARTARRPRS